MSLRVFQLQQFCMKLPRVATSMHSCIWWHNSREPKLFMILFSSLRQFGSLQADHPLHSNGLPVPHHGSPFIIIASSVASLNHDRSMYGDDTAKTLQTNTKVVELKLRIRLEDGDFTFDNKRMLSASFIILPLYLPPPRPAT